MKKPLQVLTVLAIGFAGGVIATPSALDPVRVAPHIYELAFENERVRVLKKTIRNGETPPLHTHPDRVVIYLNPCAWMESDSEGGERMQSFRFGEPTWAPAESHGGDTSDVVQECHVVIVELKPADTTGT
jgi:hypothetical protein